MEGLPDFNPQHTDHTNPSLCALSFLLLLTAHQTMAVSAPGQEISVMHLCSTGKAQHQSYTW